MLIVDLSTLFFKKETRLKPMESITRTWLSINCKMVTFITRTFKRANPIDTVMLTSRYSSFTFVNIWNIHVSCYQWLNCSWNRINSRSNTFSISGFSLSELFYNTFSIMRSQFWYIIPDHDEIVKPRTDN